MKTRAPTLPIAAWAWDHFCEAASQPATHAFPHIRVPPRSALTLSHVQHIPRVPSRSEHFGAVHAFNNHEEIVPCRCSVFKPPFRTFWSSSRLMAVVTWEPKSPRRTRARLLLRSKTNFAWKKKRKEWRWCPFKGNSLVLPEWAFNLNEVAFVEWNVY